MPKADNISEEVEEENFFKNMLPTSLIERFASVNEIANTVVYYSSELASATNGAAIRVDGRLIRSIL